MLIHESRTITPTYMYTSDISLDWARRTFDEPETIIIDTRDGHKKFTKKEMMRIMEHLFGREYHSKPSDWDPERFPFVHCSVSSSGKLSGMRNIHTMTHEKTISFTTAHHIFKNVFGLSLDDSMDTLHDCIFPEAPKKFMISEI
jgi:hypothetical protein